MNGSYDKKVIDVIIKTPKESVKLVTDYYSDENFDHLTKNIGEQVYINTFLGYEQSITVNGKTITTGGDYVILAGVIGALCFGTIIYVVCRHISKN
jgi:hypothetical protein